MNGTNLKRRSLLALVAIVTVAVVVLGILLGTRPTDTESEARIGESILLASGDDVVLMDNGTSEYQTLVYGTVLHASVGGEANSLADGFFYRYSNKISAEKESSTSPTTKVVTYGKVSNVPLSVRLAEAVESLPSDSIAWGIAYEDGVLALCANSKAALSAQTSITLSAHELYTDLYAALSEYVVDGRFVVPSSLFRVEELTKAEYEALLAADEEAFNAEAEQRKNALTEQYKNAIVTEFVTEDFGTPETGNTLTTDFGEYTNGGPDYYPTTGEHPRVLFNKNDIPAIKANIESLVGTKEYETFMKYIDADYVLTGKLPAPKQNSRGFHNWDGTVLSAIQANALAYAIYGDEFYGYRAIYAIKNFLMTLDVDYIYSDQCREFGMVMYISACVYDWCYDLLTAEDKIQIPLGVEHRLCRGHVKNTHNGILSTSSTIKMEMGFPPRAQAAMVGHGSEFQLMRDYLAMAIAVYDEMPSWYEFVGGRMYNEYIPVRRTYYSAGLYPQGMSCYAPWRFLADCYGAALIQAATGRSPYTEDMAQVVFTFASNETGIGKMFSTGDGSSVSLPTGSIGMEALVISHVLYDTNSASLLRLMADSMITSCTGTGVSTVLCSEYFVFSARDVEELEDTTWRDELPLVTYTGDYVGQYLARSEWGDNGAVIMMRIGEKTTANHDHEDAGTFQIYYKGLTSGSSGGYGTYGSDHWYYYHQATVAHNGMLIFDPSKADTVPDQIMNSDGSPKVDSYGNVSYSNEARLFYTGGQSSNGSEPTNLNNWLAGSHDRANVVGYASGYGADGTTPKFAYVAGDITKAYSTSQASFVGRTMLTVYTGNPDYPMLFFVFDNVDAAKDEFVKKFLLQINGVNAPTIDEDNKTVVVEESKGQLVLQNVLGADKIDGLGGGYGYNYLINGINCQDNSFSKQNSWGRVEVSATGADSSLMLNVLYVSDAGNSNILRASNVKAVDKKTGNRVMLEGATIGDVTALFSTEFDRTVEEIVFTAEGEGLMTYYIGGLFEGTWNVSVGGTKVGTVYSTQNSGLISFKAPAGEEITIAPGADIRPAGSEKLTYVTAGGSFAAKVEGFYMPGEGTKLNTDITRGLDLFEGWYLDREYTQKIEGNVIPDSVSGPLVVYAKWSSIFANEDYSVSQVSVINQTSGGAAANGVSYNISDSTITTYKTEMQGDLKYMFWQTTPNPSAADGTGGKTGQGPSIFVNPKDSSLASMSGEQVTYIFKFMDAGTDKDMTVGVRVRNNVKKEVGFFSIKDGKIIFDSKEVATLSETKFTTVGVVLDFAKGEVRLYTSTSHDGYSRKVELPDRSTYTTELLSMRANSQGAIKIGLIQVYEGDNAHIVKGVDVPNNYIEFPPEAIIPDGTDLSFVPNGDTVIPTEGIISEKDGIKYELVGWYADAALTQPITTVPDGVTEKFTVYAKWREADIIYYPENAILPEGTSTDYVAGQTQLVTEGVTGNVDGYIIPLIGWYLDEALTQPVTVVPAGTEGAFFVYAKWAEPNYIKYPDGVTLPDGAPTEYVTGVATPLPETAKNSASADFEFLGWYADADLTERIYEIPADASGKFTVYAKWKKLILNFAPDTETSGGPIIGYGYCVEHSDTDNNGICEVCFFCTAGCLDSDSDGKCDKCTYAVNRCGNTADKHSDANGDNRCDVCNINVKTASSGTISGISFGFSEFVAGNMTVVDNGDNDYARLFVKNGNGPAINYGGALTIPAALSGSPKHQLVYQYELAAEEGSAIMPFALRIRKNGTTPTAIFGINSKGELMTSDTAVIGGYKLTTEMTKITVVVDFDNGEIRYYYGDNYDAIAVRPYAMPLTYSTVDEWLAAEYPTSGHGLMQNRIQGDGVILIGGIQVFADEDGEYDVSKDQIIYPDGINLPQDAPKSYKAGVTVLPEDVTKTQDGIIYELVGWYSDAALTNKITTIPAGSKGDYTVYAEWAEKNYVIYPDEANIPDSAVREYAPGVSDIPLPVSGVTGTLYGKTVTLECWYLDEALTQPTTVIPVSASGAFRVYAKWNEPNVITYPASVKVDSSFPEDYVAGETALPENPQYNGTGEATFVGWYADEACTQKITVIPADASGVFHVYAVFSKSLLDLDVQAGEGTGTVSGYNYCVHSDSDTDGKCDVCGRCTAGCADGNSDHNCDVCGKCICSFPQNGSCSYCGAKQMSGSLGINGMVPNFTDRAPGYATVVENGNSDYVELHIASGGGPQYNYNGSDKINTAMVGMDRHVLVYSFEIGAKDGEAIMNAAFRFRPNNTATEFFSVKTDGTLSNCGGAKISTDSLTRVTVVVDFDNEIIKYYLGDSTEAAGSKAWTKPAQFATVDEWINSYYTIGTYGVLQIRMSSTGTILVGDVSITVNDPKYV